MASIEVFSDALMQRMLVKMDGYPVQPVSRIAKYQARPFTEWCGALLHAIADEVNDSFDLTFTGMECEARIMSMLAAAQPTCCGMRSVAPLIADTAAQRLRKLSQMSQSGLMVPRSQLIIRVYSDNMEWADQTLKQLVPKLAFCRISVSTQPMSELDSDPGNSPVIVISSSLPQNAPNRPMVWLAITGKQRLVAASNGLYVEECTNDAVADLLRSYLDLTVLIPLLKNVLSTVRVERNDPMWPDVFILDKLRPHTFVTLPISVELGTVSQIKVEVLPPFGKQDDLEYRISDETVLQFNPMLPGLRAVGTGHATVEVYRRGDNVKIASQSIAAFRRNRITVLTPTLERTSIRLGESVPFNLSFQPPDGDDARMIRLSIDRPEIAEIHGQRLVARQPGKCKLIAQSERARGEVLLTVCPHLAGLDLSVGQTSVTPGESTQLQLLRTPAGAVLEQLRYDVSPANVGRVDQMTGRFVASEPGSATVTATADNGVRASCQVSVVPIKQEKKPINPAVFIGAAGIIALIIGIISMMR